MYKGCISPLFLSNCKLGTLDDKLCATKHCDIQNSVVRQSEYLPIRSGRNSNACKPVILFFIIVFYFSKPFILFPLVLFTLHFFKHSMSERAYELILNLLFFVPACAKIQIKKLLCKSRSEKTTCLLSNNTKAGSERFYVENISKKKGIKWIANC